MKLKQITYTVKRTGFDLGLTADLEPSDSMKSATLELSRIAYQTSLILEKDNNVSEPVITNTTPKVEVKELRQANKRTISDPTPSITKKEKKFQEDMGLIPPASIASPTAVEDLPAQPRSKRLNALDKPPEPVLIVNQDTADQINEVWPAWEKSTRPDKPENDIVVDWRANPPSKENTFRGISDFMVTPDEFWSKGFGEAEQAAKTMGEALEGIAQSWGQVGEQIQQQFIEAFASNPALSDLLASMQSGKVLKKSVVDSYRPDPFALARLAGNTEQLPPEQEANRPREPPAEKQIFFYSRYIEVLLKLGYDNIWFMARYSQKDAPDPNIIQWAEINSRSAVIRNPFQLMPNEPVALRKARYKNDPKMKWGWIITQGKNLKDICDAYIELDK